MRRILLFAAPTILALGLIFPASAVHAAEPVAMPPQSFCPDVCPMIYAPVTCLYSDGTVRTLDNICVAVRYACKHDLRIIGCVPRRGAAGDR